MTEDEKAALAWLDLAITYPESHQFDTSESNRHRATIKSMLAQPKLPAEPTPDILRLLRVECEAEGAPSHVGAACYAALYAHLTHLTVPRTKEIEVWRVEYAAAPCWVPAVKTFGNEQEAEDFARAQHAGVSRCIRVTGPHKQTVPA